MCQIYDDISTQISNGDNLIMATETSDNEIER